MSEDFMLKWNDHHSLFFLGAEELCESEEYTDVTLAAGTKLFPAHKLILSICSPYFRQLFKTMGKEKTVIYLKDVDPRHLDLLLQYMYKGEIKVKVRHKEVQNKRIQKHKSFTICYTALVNFGYNKLLNSPCPYDNGSEKVEVTLRKC